jgi:hypothetical protein
MQQLIRSMFFSLGVMVLFGCYEIETVDQPIIGGPEDSIFTTSVVLTLEFEQHDPAVPNFGVCLPVGWSVVGTVPFSGDLNGLFVYDSLLSDSADILWPSPADYFWWVGNAVDTVHSLPDGSTTITPLISTDGQTGVYAIQYRVGEDVGYQQMGDHRSGFLRVGHTAPIVITPNQSSISGNVYVSAIGVVGGSGSVSDPLSTIFEATVRMSADSLNPGVIHVAEGLYSPNTTGEFFPIEIFNHISILGESESGVILGTDSTMCMIGFDDIDHATISTITINGWSVLNNSNPILMNMTIYDGLELTQSSPHIKNVTIYGSGMELTESSPHIENVIIDGGGIRLRNSSPLIEATKISGYSGTGVDIDGSSPTLVAVEISGFSVGIRCKDYSHGTLINCTITGNQSEDYDFGGILINSYSSIEIVNSILWNNSNYEIGVNTVSDNLEVSIATSNSLVKNGIAGIHHYGGGGNVYWLDGNITDNPNFNDPSNGDYNLSEGSPCIDAGIQDTIIVYNTDQDTISVPEIVFIGSAPDIGAYEYGTVSISSDDQKVPVYYGIHQNYPNPFNPSTTISFSLPEQSLVKLKVFDIRGQEVFELVDTERPPGTYEVQWNGMDDAGNRVSTGVYFCRLKAGTYSQTIKMVYMK